MSEPRTPSSAPRLYRRVEGPLDAPVLVLSNSLGTNLAMWDGLMPAFTERFRVIRYDMRGHGRSPVPRGPYTLADLALDLLGLLDEEGVGRAHLAGISLGGLTSLRAASMAPARVESLTVLSAPAQFAGSEAYRARAKLVREQGVEAIAAAVLGRWLTPPFRSANPGIAASLEAMIAATPAEGYAGCCEAVADGDIRPFAASIGMPALCVAAAEDPAVDPEDVRSLADSLPRGRFARVAGAAHLQVIEKPAEVSRLIIRHALESPRTRTTRAPTRTEGTRTGVRRAH